MCVKMRICKTIGPIINQFCSNYTCKLHLYIQKTVRNCPNRVEECCKREVNMIKSFWEVINQRLYLINLNIFKAPPNRPRYRKRQFEQCIFNKLKPKKKKKLKKIKQKKILSFWLKKTDTNRQIKSHTSTQNVCVNNRQQINSSLIQLGDIVYDIRQHSIRYKTR